MNVETVVLNTDVQLRFVLFGLECTLNVEFNPAEVERLFDDADQDPTPGGDYIFWQGRGLSVTGQVSPEAWYVSLQVESRRPIVPTLAEIEERSKYQVYRIEKRMDAELQRRWEAEQAAE